MIKENIEESFRNDKAINCQNREPIKTYETIKQTIIE